MKAQQANDPIPDIEKSYLRRDIIYGSFPDKTQYYQTLF